MDKVFEALKRIETTFSMNKEGKASVYREYTNSIYPYYQDFDLVLNALNELKQIKESKPSEALKYLKEMEEYEQHGCKVFKEEFSESFAVIRNFILMAQHYLKEIK